MYPETGPDLAQASPQEDADRLAQAKRRVAAMKAFYIHLGMFALVLLGLLAIDAATGPRWWVHWVFLGWGFGVAAHAIVVFAGLPQALASWEDRKVRELMSK